MEGYYIKRKRGKITRWGLKAFRFGTPFFIPGSKPYEVTDYR